MEATGDELKAMIEARNAGVAKIVLHMDESQLVGSSERPGLVHLHRTGLDVPTVCLFMGLSHTADRMRGVGGLCRLSRNAVVNMGAITEDECAESTRMMLDELGATGGEEQRQRTSRTIAGMAQGWPQHLNGAQTALCRELLRTDGSLAQVDSERVRSKSDRMRREHYHQRLFNTVLDMVPEATAQIVARVREARPRRMFDLEGVCEDEIERMGLDKVRRFRTTPEEFATALVERGVLAISPGGWYDVAIPSMAEWMGIGASRPSACQSDLPCR